MPLSTGVPEATTNPPEIMDVTKNSVALAWAKPRDGGSEITAYYVEYKLASSETWERHEKKITSTMYTLSGLTADAEYQFRVIAENDIGQSEPGPASDVVTCKDPFGEPTIIFKFTNEFNSIYFIFFRVQICG